MANPLSKAECAELKDMLASLLSAIDHEDMTASTATRSPRRNCRRPGAVLLLEASEVLPMIVVAA